MISIQHNNSSVSFQEYTPHQTRINTYENETNTREVYSAKIESRSFDNITFAFEMFSNETFTEYAEIPYYIKATSMTFCIVIMCLGVIGNIMVPIVILKTKDMRNSTNIFLVNLSIADLLVLLVCTPTVLVEVNSKPETWVLGKELCLAVPFVELTVAHASVLTILAISFERYYAICEPLRAGYVCTKTRATLICGLAWFFAALFTSPILGIAEHKYLENKDGRFYGQCLTQAVSFWSILFFIMITVFLYMLPLIILIILYSIIAKNLITAASKVVLNKTVDPTNTRARKQVILMLGTVVLCFFLCLMPFRLLTLYIIIAPPEYMEGMNPEKYFNILYFSRIMLYINSAINPILYNLMSSKFRIGFCKMCICSTAEGKQLRRAQRKRAGTMTTGSTTSSSLTRTTNSLKKLFYNRSSLDRNNTTKSDTDSDSNTNNSTKTEIKLKRNGILSMFSNRKFIRQQSAPICTNSRTDVPKINRMLSEGSALDITSTLDETINLEKNGKMTKTYRPIDYDCPRGSLRRSVLVNSIKASSVDEQKENKIKLKYVVSFRKSKSHDCDFPESFV